MKNNQWKHKRVLILGLGQYPSGSGMAAALFFARAGADVLVSDFYYTEAMEPNVKRLKKFKNVRFIFKKHPLDEVRKAELIIKHQRLRNDEPEVVEARKRRIEMHSAESFFISHCPCPVVGITGTRGKSTTTTLVAHMLEASGRHVWLGGNILVSPLTFLSRIKPSDIVVLELSSFQLEMIGERGISPQIACITNLMRDHLNAYPGMEDYAEAKAQIFRHQQPSDTVVLNARDAYGKLWAKEEPGRVLTFGAGDAFIKQKALFMRDGKKIVKLIDEQKLKIFGDHNAMNILAAALTARAAGASIIGIRKAALAFKGLKDREEVVAVKHGVTYVNDTTATTPDGVIAALKALSPRFKRLHVIMGGSDKELAYDAFAKVAKKLKPDLALIPGNATDKLANELEAASVPFGRVADLKEAVAYFREIAKPGDAIVLSPGAASFGAFKNEFERGERFRRLVSAKRV